jgi:Cu2+-exporting ATPase
VLAGSTNMDAVLKLRVRLAGTATTLATIGRLAASAARERPSAITFAERVAPFMVALVLAFTIAAGVYWWHAGPTKAFEVMLAVLVITCPCALSLAAPAALAAAQAAMAARGILVARLNAIEQLAKSDSVVLDKTGTLTTGRMEVSRVEVLRQGFTAPTIIRIAAALELASNHPIAQAICRANSKPVEVAANLEVVSGAGVSGELDGRSYRIGAAVYAMNGQPLPTLDDDAGVNSSMALLADGDGPIGRLYLEDPERDDARCFVASLACPKRTVTILSGDTQNTVSILANSMQIPAALGDMKPIDKKNYVAEMQRHGNTVFMIGDGINDAPVIAQADVSAAFATATTLAQTRADIIVLGNRFADVQAAMAIAKQTIRIIRQNLGWALVYNIVAIPVAASGVLTPLGAAVGMSVSSLVVVGNALRLLPRRHA